LHANHDEAAVSAKQASLEAISSAQTKSEEFFLYAEDLAVQEI
jgi:hypothetical protein